MTGIKNYSTNPASNNAAVPNGFPEGMSPAGVNDSARQVMAELRKWYEDPAWIDWGHTPVFATGTTFTITGNVTSIYLVNTRIRAKGTTPFTIYGRITGSSFSSPNTTITVVWDSGTLDSTLNEVAINKFTEATALANSITTANLQNGAVTRSKLDTQALPAVIDRAYGEYTTTANLTALIPFDDTIPQNTEGTQIISVTITPKSTTNRLRVRARLWGVVANSTDAAIMAVFRNTDANALHTSVSSGSPAVNSLISGTLEFEFVPASTSLQTINLRVSGAGSTLRLNGNSVTRLFGGTSAATLIVEEIVA